MLFEQGHEIHHVYIPEDAVVSLMRTIDDEDVLEVGLIGGEGIVGPQVLSPSGKATVRGVVQGTGSAWRLPVATFEHLRADLPQLDDLVIRHAAFLYNQATQSIACQRFHRIEQRLARWLAMMCDRTGQRQYRVTHDFLAEMLGVTRPSATLAVKELRSQGAITMKVRDLQVENLERLRATACACYGADRQAYKIAMHEDRKRKR